MLRCGVQARVEVLPAADAGGLADGAVEPAGHRIVVDRVRREVLGEFAFSERGAAKLRATENVIQAPQVIEALLEWSCNSPSQPWVMAVKPVPVVTPSTAQPLTLARDVRALQRRVRAFVGTGTVQTAPTSYQR